MTMFVSLYLHIGSQESTYTIHAIFISLLGIFYRHGTNSSCTNHYNKRKRNYAVIRNFVFYLDEIKWKDNSLFVLLTRILKYVSTVKTTQI